MNPEDAWTDPKLPWWTRWRNRRALKRAVRRNIIIIDDPRPKK